MGLSAKEKITLKFKEVEYRVPGPVSRLLLPAIKLRVDSPFRNKENDLQCIFCHIPKTAGTSIANAIFGEKARHIPLSRYYLFDKDRTQRYFKFAVVRNPWSRLFSAYNYLHARVGTSDFRDHRWATEYLSSTPDFESFLNRLQNRRYRNQVMGYVHFRNQLDWVSIGSAGSRHLFLDQICRFETLQDDFKSLAARLGVSATLPALRTGGGGDYEAQYTDRMKSFVYDLYQKDIATFGYEFDGNPRAFD